MLAHNACFHAFLNDASTSGCNFSYVSSSPMLIFSVLVYFLYNLISTVLLLHYMLSFAQKTDDNLPSLILPEMGYLLEHVPIGGASGLYSAAQVRQLAWILSESSTQDSQEDGQSREICKLAFYISQIKLKQYWNIQMFKIYVYIHCIIVCQHIT